MVETDVAIIISSAICIATVVVIALYQKYTSTPKTHAKASDIAPEIDGDADDNVSINNNDNNNNKTTTKKEDNKLAKFIPHEDDSLESKISVVANVTTSSTKPKTKPSRQGIQKKKKKPVYKTIKKALDDIDTQIPDDADKQSKGKINKKEEATK